MRNCRLLSDAAHGTQPLLEAGVVDFLVEALGPKAAALVRAGVIELSDLVEHEELDSDQPGFITQKPVDQLIGT